MSEELDFSVVIPVKNGALTLAGALSSILRQSLTNIEILIVDDASNDRTGDIIQSAAERDRRIRPMRNPGVGLVDALNAGVAAARSSWIARMDADDIAVPDRLDKQKRMSQSDPSIVALGTQYCFWREKGAHKTGPQLPTRAEDVRSALRRGEAALAHPSVVFQRSAFLAVGGYRRAFHCAEDIDLWLRLCEIGQVRNTDYVGLIYRAPPQEAYEQAGPLAKVVRSYLSHRLALSCDEARRSGMPEPVAGHDAPPDYRVEAFLEAGDAWPSQYLSEYRICAALVSLLERGEEMDEQSRMSAAAIISKALGSGWTLAGAKLMGQLVSRLEAILVSAGDADAAQAIRDAASASRRTKSRIIRSALRVLRPS